MSNQILPFALPERMRTFGPMSNTIPAPIQSAIETRLGLAIRGSRPLGGGCIHHAQQVQTTRGDYFLKYNQRREAPNFAAEEKGLRLIEETHTLPVPKPILRGEVGDFAFLVLEYVTPGRQSGDFWEHFGEKLAQLHRHSAPSFGLDHDNYIGALPQSNRQRNSWPTFFVEERIQPMLRMAFDQGRMDPGSRTRWDAFLQRVDQFFPAEPPALLHGDLWGGNFLADTSGQVVVIDPAVYYGHREMELAFMQLFDSHSAAFYDAYHSTYPLEKGWQSRMDLYNLYPLLVHVNLFGGGYATTALRILKAYS